MPDAIRIVRNAGDAELARLGVLDWPVWSKEVSRFPWHYDTEETCYLLSGEVTVTPQNGEPVQISQGDLVTFPAGLSCTWDIRAPLRKHYRL